MRLALGPRNPCHCTSFCCTPSGVPSAGRERGQIRQFPSAKIPQASLLLGNPRDRAGHHLGDSTLPPEGAVPLW